MPLIVTKSDGNKEVYLHTKVMGTIAATMSDCGCYQEEMTNCLAEAVTLFSSRRHLSCDGCRFVRSDEIHSMIKAVFCETGYDQCAMSLQEHRSDRQVKRNRALVVHVQGAEQNCPPQMPKEVEHHGNQHPSISLSSTCAEGIGEYWVEPWNKSIIVTALEDGTESSHNLARMVAGAVEENILKLPCRRLFASVVREMVRNELWCIKQSENSLQGRLDPMTSSPMTEPAPQTAEGVEWDDVAAECIGLL